MANDVTNGKLYQELTYLRKEIKSDMQTLKDEMKGHLDPIRQDIAEIKAMYVLKAEFKPVKQIVYGAVGVILATILALLVRMVTK